jgi:hypothetical protein
MMTRPDFSANHLRVSFAILSIAWIVTALLLGGAATHIQKLRSWWGIIIGTVVGSFFVLGAMLIFVKGTNGPAPVPKFKDTDEMMVYFANETTTWVKQDKGIDLNYSMESIEVIEDALDRISKEVNKTNPQRGTLGTAMGYGAYIGEVFRRRLGGTWSADHPIAGTGSYPLTMQSNNVTFPVGWCWKRLINGEEDNVYHKAMAAASGWHNGTNLTNVKSD